MLRFINLINLDIFLMYRKKLEKKISNIYNDR